MSRLTITLLATALLMTGTHVLADSSKQKNNNQSGQQQGQSHKKQNNDYEDGKYQHSDSKKSHYEDDDEKYSGKKHRSYQEDYDEDYSDIHRIFEQHKGKSKGYQSLPPGISKNLQRGKPLPPGIAKKFNTDIERQLPYYPGHEWRQVGTDAVLIDATTSVVQEVMKGVLQ